MAIRDLPARYVSMKLGINTINSIEQTYVRLLGESYAKAKEVKAWLRGRPQKALILAYLADTKPESK